ncbi:unnamed protein product [Laminaria digitata]
MMRPWAGAGLALILSLWAGAALAQGSSCPSTDDDAFAVARRSRRVVSDYQDLHRIHREDLARNEALYVRQTGEPMPWRFALAGVVDWSRTFDYDVCSNQGPWQGSLQPLRLGAIASLSLPGLGFSLETFVVFVQDRIVASPTVEQTRTEDGQVRDPTGLANVYTNETFYGGRVTVLDWASVVGGYIATAATQSVVGEDGRELLVRGQTIEPRGRVYLGAGIPRYHLFANVLFDEADIEADQLGLRLDRLPLPWWSLQAIAAVSWIDDEEQAVLTMGVGNVFGLFTVETAFEHRPVALRYARVRVDWATSFGSEPPARIVPPEQAQPRFAFDLGTFAELSWYGSRYLEDQTGDGGAVGTYAGFFARPDVTLLMAQLDFYFGVNRPEVLDRLVQAAGHWQVGVRFHGRFGL